MSEETKKRIGIFAAIAAAVVVIYWLLRGGGQSTVAVVPGTGQSGLPQSSPQNDVFNVVPPVLAPSPAIQATPAVYNTSLNIGGAGGNDLSYNFPPIGSPAPVATPKKNGCGCDDCKSPCAAANNSTYTDGNGQTCLDPQPNAAKSPTVLMAASAVGGNYNSDWIYNTLSDLFGNPVTPDRPFGAYA